MQETLTDLVSDNVTDACKRLGLHDVHALFLKISIDAGMNDAHGCAQTAFFIWAREGEEKLPANVREAILRICNHEYHH